MLYYLFTYLDERFDIPGAGLFQFISFRAACSIILSLTISLIFGKRLIAMLRRRQVGETVRDLGLEGQKAKEGTPTMGGIDHSGCHHYSHFVIRKTQQCVCDHYADRNGLAWYCGIHG